MKVQVGGGLEIWTADTEVGGEVDLGVHPSAAEVTAAVAAGHRVLVRFDGTSSGAAPVDAEFLAEASIYAWLGAEVFVVPEAWVDTLRQVLEMVASIKGVRPPTLTRRALA